jgi:hypothetical protein
MGPNRRAQKWERAAAETATKAKDTEAARKAIGEAQKIVAWNARQAGVRFVVLSDGRSSPGLF